MEFIKIKLSQFEEILRMLDDVRKYDFYILTDKAKTMFNKTPNIYDAETLMPSADSVATFDNGLLNERVYKASKAMDSKSVKFYLGGLIEKSIRLKRNVIFIMEDFNVGEEASHWSCVVLKHIESRYKINCVNLEDYKEGIKSSYSRDTYNIAKNDIKENLDSNISNKFGGEIINPKIDIPIECPEAIYDRTFEDVTNIGMVYNIIYDGLGKKRYRRKVIRAIKDDILSRIPDTNFMLNMDRTSLITLTNGLKIDIPKREERTNEEIVYIIESKRRQLSSDEIPPLNVLMQMSLKDLYYMCMNNDIELLSSEKMDYIKELGKISGEMMDVTLGNELLTIDYLNQLSDSELLTLSIKEGLSLPSFVNRNQAIKMITQVNEMKLLRDSFKDLKIEDLNEFNYGELKDICIGLDIIEENPPIDKYTKEMLKGYIIKDLNLKSINEPEKISKEDEILDIKASDLMNKTIQELINFCEKYDIEIDDKNDTKPEIAEAIIREYKKKSNIVYMDDKELEADINVSEFNVENFMKCSKSQLLDFCEYNDINVTKSMTKEEISFVIAKVINPDYNYQLKGIEDKEENNKQSKTTIDEVFTDFSNIITEKTDKITSFSDVELPEISNVQKKTRINKEGKRERFEDYKNLMDGISFIEVDKDKGLREINNEDEEEILNNFLKNDYFIWE